MAATTNRYTANVVMNNVLLMGAEHNYTKIKFFVFCFLPSAYCLLLQVTRIAGSPNSGDSLQRPMLARQTESVRLAHPEYPIGFLRIQRVDVCESFKAR